MRLFQLLVFSLGLGLFGCQSAPPPIGKDLPGGSMQEVSDVFDKRIQARFPVGSREKDLLTELHHEHFKVKKFDSSVSRYRYAAERNISGHPCRRFWNIEWNSASGKITEIAGTYSGGCV